MKSTSEYQEIIENAIANLDLPSTPKGLYQPIVYALESGGKRLRPVLSLAVADALGLDLEAVINQALGVELFHNFTLLHDDVMDNSEVRRGRPTVHCRWNARTAILSGDAMSIISGEVVTRGAGEHIAEVLTLFNKTAIEVIEGQQLDMDFENRKDVTEDDYIEMVRLKTAVLLGCACKVAAIMAGAGEDIANAFYDYGEKLGLAFQLRDDYLDTFGDPAIFGKAIGGDITSDKKTWLLINAIRDDKTGTIEKWLGNNARPDEKIQEVTECYRILDLDKRCSQLIDSYIEAAIAQLNRIPALTEEARHYFVGLADRSRTRSN
ncbi:MAG: polyprenyl synthetase family protein [Muribaculaceae bacterium]|nr:polyprenyl synthetase family protein [Muribaculaceae bacterium]